MRILVLTAHPDDAEVMAGGSIARWTSEGHLVDIRCVFPTMGRYDEGVAGANILGATFAYMHAPTTRGKSAEIDKYVFDRILTPSPLDSHQEHRKAAELGTLAARKNDAALWRMNLAIPGGLANPPLNHYVRFGNRAQDQKLAAMQAHKSQWEKFGGWDWWGQVEPRDTALGHRLPGPDRQAEGFEIVFSYE
jgi:LmbE family N-acetylglucosaminyl deacetylase